MEKATESALQLSLGMALTIGFEKDLMKHPVTPWSSAVLTKWRPRAVSLKGGLVTRFAEWLLQCNTHAAATIC